MAEEEDIFAFMDEFERAPPKEDVHEGASVTSTPSPTVKATPSASPDAFSKLEALTTQMGELKKLRADVREDDPLDPIPEQLGEKQAEFEKRYKDTPLPAGFGQLETVAEHAIDADSTKREKADQKKAVAALTKERAEQREEVAGRILPTEDQPELSLAELGRLSFSEVANVGDENLTIEKLDRYIKAQEARKMMAERKAKEAVYHHPKGWSGARRRPPEL